MSIPYPQETKDIAGVLREQGLSYSAIGRELGICRKTITRWLDPEINKRNIEYNRLYKTTNSDSLRDYDRDYRNSLWGCAYLLLKDSRKRERYRGVPEDQQIDIYAWMPLVMWIIQNSPWEWDLTKRYPDGTRKWSPSLSRIDHSNPRYTNNFVVEPMWINARRDQEDPTGIVCPWVLKQLSPEDILKIEYEPLRIDDPKWDFLMISPGFPEDIEGVG